MSPTTYLVVDGKVMKPDKIQRKTLLVSIYYYQDEPITSLEDWEAPDYLFLNDVIHDTMKIYNPASDVFDVAIDETKPWIFSVDNRFARYFFRLLRSR
jgi:hypothetical protein